MLGSRFLISDRNFCQCIQNVLCYGRESDIDNGKQYKFVCITTNHPDTKGRLYRLGLS